MIKETVDNYLSGIYHMFSRGDAREESYYTILESFILKTRYILNQPDLQVTIMPKKTEAGNPDLVIKDAWSGVVGYLEAKDPAKNLEDVENSSQIKRYLEVFPNFILTNFLEFRLYRYGKPKAVVSIASQDSLVKMRIKPAAANEKECLELFKEYLSYRFPHDFNARELAQELAKRTRLMRDYVVMEELNPPAGSIDKNKENHILGFYQAFKKYLIHDLSKKDFADLYSQTLTFGLFTAATRCKEKLKRELAVNYIPTANGILHDVFEFISLGEVPQQLKCSMDDIVHVINSVDTSSLLQEYGWDRKGDDPVFHFLHFYETFLSEYDPRLREKRGVYYTPQSIVHFIAWSIHLVLKDKLNQPDGLADPGVKVLDPAAGTSTFLVQVAQLAIDEYIKKYGEGTREDFAHGYLLNNLYGFEVMMAPYAVAYLKMAYLLEQTGLHLEKGERFNIYLTNALELEDTEQADLPGMSTLSRESRRAGEIKKKSPYNRDPGQSTLCGTCAYQKRNPHQ